MSEISALPKIGDRVRFNGADPVFVVVDVDQNTRTASLIPAEDVATVPLEKIEHARAGSDRTPNIPVDAQSLEGP